jgi:hypothetical protein
MGGEWHAPKAAVNLRTHGVSFAEAVVAEKYRDIDFSGAKRGPVVNPESGKTKISIRLDNVPASSG